MPKQLNRQPRPKAMLQTFQTWCVCLALLDAEIGSTQQRATCVQCARSLAISSGLTRYWPTFLHTVRFLDYWKEDDSWWFLDLDSLDKKSNSHQTQTIIVGTSCLVSSSGASLSAAGVLPNRRNKLSRFQCPSCFCLTTRGISKQFTIAFLSTSDSRQFIAIQTNSCQFIIKRLSILCMCDYGLASSRQDVSSKLWTSHSRKRCSKHKAMQNATLGIKLVSWILPWLRPMSRWALGRKMMKHVKTLWHARRQSNTWRIGLQNARRSEKNCLLWSISWHASLPSMPAGLFFCWCSEPAPEHQRFRGSLQDSTRQDVSQCINEINRNHINAYHDHIICMLHTTLWEWQ